MPNSRRIRFEDLRIEDIKGALFCDTIAKFGDNSQMLLMELRRFGNDIRREFSWRGPISTDFEEQDDQGEESLKPVAMKCEDPKFVLRVRPIGAEFLFDKVQDHEAALKVLARFLQTTIDTLALENVKKLGLQFHHIFRLKPQTKNYTVLARTLLPGLASGENLYSYFGEGVDWRRADLAWVYYRRNGELITETKLESPGNESNTTVWLWVDTQTAGDILDMEELSRLEEYLAYYRSIVEGLLQKVFREDELDTQRREMMVDGWFAGNRNE